MSEDSVAEVHGESPAPPHAHHDRDWWDRDHPTFLALTGFFAGLAYVALVPAAFAGILTWAFGERTAHEAFLFVLLLLVLPLVLLMLPRTLRFGKYMLLGMLATALVVVGVGWMTWLLMMHGGAG